MFKLLLYLIEKDRLHIPTICLDTINLLVIYIYFKILGVFLGGDFLCFSFEFLVA